MFFLLGAPRSWNATGPARPYPALTLCVPCFVGGPLDLEALTLSLHSLLVNPGLVAGVAFLDSDSAPVPKLFNPVSSEISDLCEISDLQLFVSYLLLRVKE